MPTSLAGKISKRARARRGMTLLEMLVVLAIVGLIAGLSFPSVTAGLEGVRMVSATDSVAAFLNAAVNRAQRRQEPVEVVVDFRENVLAAYSTDPTFTKQLRLPQGIAFDSANPNEPRRILFLPGATVPGIGISLSNRRGRTRIVKLDPMTGFPRVEIPAGK